MIDEKRNEERQKEIKLVLDVLSECKMKVLSNDGLTVKFMPKARHKTRHRKKSEALHLLAEYRYCYNSHTFKFNKKAVIDIGPKEFKLCKIVMAEVRNALLKKIPQESKQEVKPVKPKYDESTLEMKPLEPMKFAASKVYGEAPLRSVRVQMNEFETNLFLSQKNDELSMYVETPSVQLNHRFNIQELDEYILLLQEFRKQMCD